MVQPFNFGSNWKNYSKYALSGKKIETAKLHFDKLFENIDLNEKSFLDIGFGQGLSLLIATEKNANTVGCDINPLCSEVLLFNMKMFNNNLNEIPVVIGSINDETTVENILKLNDGNLFDIVHSWGVLHHTGNMWKAIEKSKNLVTKNGIFVIAIYNKHFTAKFWHLIKKVYNSSGWFIKNLMLAGYLPLIFIRYLLYFQNPMKLPRGMNIYYDAIDWLGGYPYQYASIDEILDYMNQNGFTQVRIVKTSGFTGCNEFVFKKTQV
jgi:SAM-dependent methyltransferase